MSSFENTWVDLDLIEIQLNLFVLIVHVECHVLWMLLAQFDFGMSP